MAGAGAIATHIVRRGIQVNMRSSWRCILSDARTPSKAAAANCRLRWSASCEQRACVLAFYCMNAAMNMWRQSERREGLHNLELDMQLSEAHPSI